MRLWTRFISLRIWSSGSCEHSYKPFGSKNDSTSLNQLRDCQLLKKQSALWSEISKVWYFKIHKWSSLCHVRTYSNANILWGKKIWKEIWCVILTCSILYWYCVHIWGGKVHSIFVVVCFICTFMIGCLRHWDTFYIVMLYFHTLKFQQIQIRWSKFLGFVRILSYKLPSVNL